MIYRGQGFHAFVWFSSSPTPFPPLPSASCLSFSVFLCVAGRAYWGEKWVGDGWNQIIRPRERLALYKPFNTLWKIHNYPKTKSYVTGGRWPAWGRCPCTARSNPQGSPMSFSFRAGRRDMCKQVESLCFAVLKAYQETCSLKGRIWNDTLTEI